MVKLVYAVPFAEQQRKTARESLPADARHTAAIK